MSSWSIAGKRCIVTGANSGIGKATATELARRGAEVVMVCRSRDRGEAALADIRRDAGSDDVALMLCDMASLDSMKAFAAAFTDRYDRLDVLVNNAGMMFGTRELTADGYERTFEINHLGYFVVTYLLLDVLKASAPARIVSVSSTGHKMGKLDWGNLQGEKKYSEMGAYCTSKLLNVLHTYELARRLDGTGVTANCLHPGAVGSNFGSTGGRMMRTAMKLGRRFLLTPEKGARTSIHLAASPEVDGVTGRYFARCKPARSSKKSHDRHAQERLWSLSEEMAGLA